MIVFRSRGALFGECWYEEAPSSLEPPIDVLALRKRRAAVAGARCDALLTIASDLTLDEATLFGRLSSACRSKVRRAERRDQLELEFDALPHRRLPEFRACYDGFAAQIGLQPADPEWLLAACDAQQLVLATAASRHGEPLVWHAYVVSPDAVCLHFSVARFRGLPDSERARVGRANRWLHWQCMLRFRELGKHRFDFGGLFEHERSAEQSGINRFKREFGGCEERAYDCLLPMTLKGSVRLQLKRLGDGVRALSALRPRPRQRETESPAGSSA